MRGPIVLALLLLGIGAADVRTPEVKTGDLRPQLMARVNLDLPVGSYSQITVTGNGGDLDCYLYKAAPKGKLLGEFIARDMSSLDGCVMGLTPRSEEDGRYLLLVQNTSDHVEKYTVTIK